MVIVVPVVVAVGVVGGRVVGMVMVGVVVMGGMIVVGRVVGVVVVVSQGRGEAFRGGESAVHFLLRVTGTLALTIVVSRAWGETTSLLNFE